MFKEQDLMKEFLKQNSIQYCEGLYIVGERLYGYATPESPYEIFVIVKSVFFDMKECYNFGQLIDKFENKFKSDLMDLGVTSKPQKLTMF